MKKTCTRMVALLILITPFVQIEKTEDDPEIIETRTFDQYKINRPEEIQKNCPVEELNAYSLWGDSKSLGEPNPICPSIQQNCCGVRDQRRINYIWQTDRKRQEAHYRLILKINRYILGYGKQYEDIARNIRNSWKIQKMKGGKGQEAPKRMGGQDDISVELNLPYSITPTKFCSKHAKKVLDSGFTERRKAEAFYADLSTKVEFLENARRGFYCSLCAGEAKKHFSTHYKIFDWLYDDRIYYDKEFCSMIHEWTFRTIYTTWKSFRPHVSSTMKMMACISPLGEKGSNGKISSNSRGPANGVFAFNAKMGININLQLEDPFENLSDSLKEVFDNPIVSDQKFKMETCNHSVPGDFFFFTNCELFCQKWNIAKPTSLFDGKVKNSKLVYDYLLQYEFALLNSEQNIFRDKMNDLKKIIHDAYLEHQDKPFYTSIARDIKFHKYQSDFLAWQEGLNPMKLAAQSTLEFEYKKSPIANVLAGLVALILFLAF